MWEGGRPRLIIDFQAERAVPKQSAECKPCAKVRVTDTPGLRGTSLFPPSTAPCLISALASLAPVFPSFSAVLCCAVLCSAELVLLLCRARQCWEHRRGGKAEAR